MLKTTEKTTAVTIPYDKPFHLPSEYESDFEANETYYASYIATRSWADFWKISLNSSKPPPQCKYFTSVALNAIFSYLECDGRTEVARNDLSEPNCRIVFLKAVSGPSDNLWTLGSWDILKQKDTPSIHRISLSEARAIALSTLKQAESERLHIAEEEANKGINWEEEVIREISTPKKSTVDMAIQALEEAIKRIDEIQDLRFEMFLDEIQDEEDE